MSTPTLDDARGLMEIHIASLALRNHCKAVAATMGFIARSKGQDEQKWAAIGMVHDLDWEQYPEEHCQRTKQFLEQALWPEDSVRAVLAHGWQICTDVKPLTELEKTLYAIDELTGFVTACALVRPSKSVCDLEVKSVRKKWKSAAFAAGVDRDVIVRGTGMLGVELDELIQTVIDAMREVADDIGL